MDKTHDTLPFSLMKTNAREAETLLKQLANANRLALLCQLIESEKTVGHLADFIGLSQSSVSQHLAKLREAKLVTSEKRGQQVYYRIASTQAQTLLSVLYFMFCKPS